MKKKLEAVMGKRKEFSVSDAFLLMDRLVERKPSAKPGQDGVHKIGVVSGLLNINDEVEIVVKFMDGLSQYTYEEMNENLILLMPNV
jgi:hypothetical protein